MDYAAPALLALLALLGIAIYARLGHLKKEARAKRGSPGPGADRDGAVRMYAVVAKVEVGDGETVMKIKYEGAGADLQKAISSKAVTELFLKGCAFAVAKQEGGRPIVDRAGDGTYFKIALDADNAKSPFIASGGNAGNAAMNDFAEVYLMAH